MRLLSLHQRSVDVRFRRADGRLANFGEIGIIEVRSPAVASGYRNNPGLTSQSFQQGWYNTGDLGRLDEDGFLRILGRAVDAQEIGGTLVTPTEIEDALCRHPSIRYSAVVRDSEAHLTIAAVTPWAGCPSMIGNAVKPLWIASASPSPPRSWYRLTVCRSLNRASPIVRQSSNWRPGCVQPDLDA